METALEITGEVGKKSSFSFDNLAALPGQIPDIAILVPGRSGAAVPLKSLIEASRPSAKAAFITIEAEEGYSASVPLDAVIDHAIVWYRVGEGPVPDRDGGPLRFLIPDVAACKTAEVDACANVKHLRRLVLSAEKGPDTRPKSRREHRELHENETS